MSFVIEIGHEHVDACNPDGSDITTGDLFEALDQCTGSGDAEDACRYVFDYFNPAFRIVKAHGNEYRNMEANLNDKRECCESIYFESETDFSDEDNCNLYLIWEAAHRVMER